MLAHAVNNTVWSTLTSKVVGEPDFARASRAASGCVVRRGGHLVLVTGPANLSRRHLREEPLALLRESEQQMPVGASRT